MTAKEYLSQARTLDMRIKSKLQQIESLNELATSCTITYSDMPRNPNHGGSKVERAVLKIIDLQESLKKDVEDLVELKEQEHKENLKELQGDYSQITWGSQIRSYVFHPYTMVKDHRTGAEVGNVEAVMDGDIDYFINEKLKQRD